ncbi:MAG: AAA family ATPase [Phycisphaerales bacterium]
MNDFADLPPLDLVLNDPDEVTRRCAAFRSVFDRLRHEIGKVIVGQERIVEDTLIGLFADGHVLLEGVPGLGKTLLVRTLSQALALPFKRIQFTPDLMPADIVGTNVVMENRSTGRRSLEFRPGPIFAQIILADEINRATPKTQAALLEAMQERRVTVSGHTYELNQPFLVLATQNPIEQEGTFTLPEAQLDRFLLKLTVPYTTRREMIEILERTTSTRPSSIEAVIDGTRIRQAQRLVRRVVVADHVQDYAIRLVLATHPDNQLAPSVSGRYIKVGVSPRGAQAIILVGKARALIAGRYAVSFRDIEDAVKPALRHRVLVNFEAESEGVTSDDVLDELIRIVPHEAPDRALEGAS